MALEPHQSSYNATQDKGLQGGLVNGEDFNAFSRTVETAAGIGFGKPAAAGAADRGCIIMAAGEDFLGITRRNPAVDPEDGDLYAQYREASIVNKGVIWVTVGEPVAARAAANYDTATGKWTDAAVAGTVIACAGCKFDTSANANELAAVRINRD